MDYWHFEIPRYQDIKIAMSSKQFVKEYWKPLQDIYGTQCKQESGFTLISQWMINKNPPEHTKIRRLLSLVLSAKKMNDLNDTIIKIVDDLIDEFIEKKEIDLVKEYAFKIPALVICHILGIPKSDQQFLFETAALPNVLLDPTYLSREVLDKANRSVDELKSYFGRLCSARKNNLGDDIVSLLLTARDKEGWDLSDEELVSNLFFLFGAGHETTMNLISNGIYTLHKHPDQLELLKKRDDLMPGAIIEMLRFEAPVQVASPSVAVDDFTIDGVVIPKGKMIIPILGSACRDPAGYEHPNVFDITREHKATLAFGFGIHLCLGAQLAKIEGAIAIDRLLKRLPHLHLGCTNEPKWKAVISVRGLTELPVFW